MRRGARNGLIALGVALFAVTVILQNDIDPKRDRIQKPIQGRQKTNLIFQLPGPYILASFTGMRESVAGLLWVRADEFFHNGDYESILPLVRLITWLDPHYMDVYKTGAWHLDYNITDSQERSDRRYIPPALALLREGIENNPTYDLPFDMGFTHYYLKIRDYESAANWMEKARKLPDLNPETADSHQPFPVLVDRMLSHMYEKGGNIEASKRSWQRTIAKTKGLMKKYPKDGMLDMDLILAERNYNMMLWREKHRKYDIYPPIDVQFEATWARKKPKVLVVSGKLNMISRSDYLKLNPAAGPEMNKESMRVRMEAIKDAGWVDGARVDVVLMDEDYTEPKLKEFSWQVPSDVTIMMDYTRVVNGKFEFEIDMSRDPHMYSFSKKKYKLTVKLDPRAAPDYVHDRIGWRGEGMTDKNYLDTKTVPGVRMLRKEWTIDRKDLI